MLRPRNVLPVLVLSLIAGCAAPEDPNAASGSPPPTLLNANTAGKQQPSSGVYVTVSIDDTSNEPEVIKWLRWNNAKIEKDGNGDQRVYDSPGCRRALVQYRRMLRLRLDVIAQNVANANTTHDERGEKNPYRRKVVVVDKGGSIEIKIDPSPFRKNYDPSNPDADTSGYVQLPNIDTSIEYVKATETESEYRMVVRMLQHFDQTVVDDDAAEPTAAQAARQFYSPAPRSAH